MTAADYDDDDDDDDGDGDGDGDEDDHDDDDGDHHHDHDCSHATQVAKDCHDRLHDLQNPFPTWHRTSPTERSGRRAHCSEEQIAWHFRVHCSTALGSSRNVITGRFESKSSNPASWIEA